MYFWIISGTLDSGWYTKSSAGNICLKAGAWARIFPPDSSMKTRHSFLATANHTQWIMHSQSIIARACNWTFLFTQNCIRGPHRERLSQMTIRAVCVKESLKTLDIDLPVTWLWCHGISFYILVAWRVPYYCSFRSGKTEGRCYSLQVRLYPPLWSQSRSALWWYVMWKKSPSEIHCVVSYQPQDGSADK